MGAEQAGREAKRERSECDAGLIGAQALTPRRRVVGPYPPAREGAPVSPGALPVSPRSRISEHRYTAPPLRRYAAARRSAATSSRAFLITSSGVRLRSRVIPTFELTQMNHLVGSRWNQRIPLR